MGNPFVSLCFEDFVIEADMTELARFAIIRAKEHALGEAAERFDRIQEQQTLLEMLRALGFDVGVFLSGNHLVREYYDRRGNGLEDIFTILQPFVRTGASVMVRYEADPSDPGMEYRFDKTGLIVALNTIAVGRQRNLSKPEQEAERFLTIPETEITERDAQLASARAEIIGLCEALTLASHYLPTDTMAASIRDRCVAARIADLVAGQAVAWDRDDLLAREASIRAADQRRTASRSDSPDGQEP